MFQQHGIKLMVVSIAFRRFGPPALDDSLSSPDLAGGVSIAFRRFGPPALARERSPARMSSLRLHCLSAFRPPGSEERLAQVKIFQPLVSIAFRRFGPPAQWSRHPMRDSGTSSPLPFGVSAPRLGYSMCATQIPRSCLHCLSAFRPPGSLVPQVKASTTLLDVSIAFRRFGPPALQ